MKRFFCGLLLLSVTTACNSSTPSGNGPGSSSEKGVILLRYAVGSESTEQREAGFLETLQQDAPNITILSSDQYSGTTPETSLEKSQQLLLKYRKQVTGVFAVCEPNATGMLEALDQTGLAGQVKFIGFDPNERMVAAMRDGHMHGIVLQDPVKMGYLAVKTMVDHLDGKEVERRIPTGEYLATPENMDTPEMDKLLQPEQYQGADPAPENAKYTLAVIPKGTTHEFWNSVHAGAVQAANELGNVAIIWKGPLQENDRDTQINLVQDFISRKVDGICLAPLDARSLVDPVAQAKAAGIPTVIFDSGLEQGDDPDLFVSYVATDNYQGGALAARHMAEILPASSEAPDSAETPDTSEGQDDAESQAE